LKIFPNASYTEWRVIIDNEAITRLELTITLIKIFIKPKRTPVLLCFIKRNAITGSIIVKDIQYPFTIGDTPKAFAEPIKPNLIISNKSIVCVMVPIRCPIMSTAIINVNPIFFIFCIFNLL
jgi:hypothetical protein